jgi:hypothetical protein
VNRPRPHGDGGRTAAADGKPDTGELSLEVLYLEILSQEELYHPEESQSLPPAPDQS